jgi:glycosyltransferase involved in cell wall biosynthesis
MCGKKFLLSVVVPCFNEEDSVEIFLREMKKIEPVLSEKKVSLEFVFVDDGSTDGTLKILKELSQNDSRIRFVSFSRNFGKEAALYAGLLKARGDFVATMDADLQDPPELIPRMIEELSDGEKKFDCVATRRVTRKGEPKIRSLFARLFYKILKNLSDIEVVDGARDFRVMTKKYRDAVISLSERTRFTKGIFPWVGFATKWLEYENVERAAGKTKWSFRKLFLYSIDGIVAFSTKPLMFSSLLGLVESSLAIFVLIFVVVRRMIFGDPVAGWASTICIILFTTGLNMFVLGISGQYIAKIYTEAKRRPIFIVREESF